ncbi:hypothetical protein FKM82_005219 [Ascaphus truei]
MGNQSTLSLVEFVLLGFSDVPHLKVPLSIVFLTMFLVTLAGNTCIIFLIIVDHQLHTPMYIFLCNLSIADICFTSTTIPQILRNLMTKTKTISFSGCMGQLFFCITFSETVCVLLTVMAYDRYLAICHPLAYNAIMNRRVCVLLARICWGSSSLNSAFNTFLAARLSYCGSNIIDHFFCDLTPLLKLSCSDTSLNWLLILIEGTLLVVVPFLIIIMSYLLIITTILRIPSREGRQKVFSTCSSHLIVVALFFGTITFVNLRLITGSHTNKDKVVSVMYTTVSSMLNPFIYSLRNNEIKRTFLRILYKNDLLPQDLHSSGL